MDPVPFRDIPVYGHDLLMVYDYTRLRQSDLQGLSLDIYKQLHLVAWSMGVWAAGYLLAGQEYNLTTATALNGTLTPIDDRFGIGCRAFQDMVRTFSTQTLGEFYDSMFAEQKEAKRFKRCKPQRSQDDIFHELVALQRHYAEHGPADNIYGRKLVGSRDRIFPARNQVRSWGKGRCTVINAPHFPFYGWPSWDTVITGGEPVA